MDIHETEIKPKYRSDKTLIVFNTILFIVFTASLWILIAQYYRRINVISFNENRFLTTEWEVLQVLQSQTQNQLIEKDREIAELQRRYATLSQSSETLAILQDIENQLIRAQEERDLILRQRLELAPPDNPDNVIETSDLTVPTNEQENPLIQTGVTQLLEEKISLLESQIEEKIQIIDKNQEELANFSRRIINYLRKARGIQADVDQILMDLRSVSTLSMEALSTQALLRALLSTPEIKTEYPDILTSLDAFLEQYGQNERLRGKSEAYEDLQEKLSTLFE